MSTRLSPDGMYYWDGAHWVSTLSPDGRFRWNGASWVPASTVPYQFIPQPTVREPTSWTRPLQYAVAAWYVLSTAVTLSIPFWFSSLMTQTIRASFEQQQARNPGAAPPPPGFFDQINAMTTVVLWIAVFFALAIAVLFIIAAIKRWIWAYYVVLVFLGFSVLRPVEPAELSDPKLIFEPRLYGAGSPLRLRDRRLVPRDGPVRFHARRPRQARTVGDAEGQPRRAPSSLGSMFPPLTTATVDGPGSSCSSAA